MHGILFEILFQCIDCIDRFIVLQDIPGIEEIQEKYERSGDDESTNRSIELVSEEYEYDSEQETEYRRQDSAESDKSESFQSLQYCSNDGSLERENDDESGQKYRIHTVELQKSGDERREEGEHEVCRTSEDEKEYIGEPEYRLHHDKIFGVFGDLLHQEEADSGCQYSEDIEHPNQALEFGKFMDAQILYHEWMIQVVYRPADNGGESHQCYVEEVVHFLKS